MGQRAHALDIAEQIERLSKRWRKHISDTAPEHIFESLLTRYSYQFVSHGVDAAIRRYGRGGMDYKYAVRYMASAARNRHNEQAVFRGLPAEWLKQL